MMYPKLRRSPSLLTFLLLLSVGATPSCSGSDSESEEIYVKMEDGTDLATDLFLPEGDGPFPTLLIRTPYGKHRETSARERFIPRGVAVVVQDTRGSSGSEGSDPVFLDAGVDGRDTCAWILEQPWSNGIIATLGESALGIAEYLLAPTAAPGLAAMSVSVATPNLYSDVLFQNGVRRQSLVHGWLKAQGSVSFEETIAAHPFEDEFWDSVQTLENASSVEVAALHVVGWYDIFQQGGLDAYHAYQHEGGEGATGKQKLVIGPWAHTSGSELTYPEHSEQPPTAKVEDSFLNHYLGVEGEDDDVEFKDIPNVQYYVMGDVDDDSAPGNEWRTASDWPLKAANIRFHLSSNGSLGEECPSEESSSSDYLFDPEDPSPTLCGNNLMIDAGSCDQRQVEAREDQLLFETPILEEAMEVTGRIRAHLYVDIDQEDTDIMVRLTDVYPDGRSMLVADGALRLASRNSTTTLDLLKAEEIVEAVVDLWSTSIVFNKGHRLRVSITSSNFPRFAVNHNNGQPYPESVRGAIHPVMVRVHHDATIASYIELPDPSRDQADVRICSE